MPRPNKRHAFSLVELMISVSLLLVIIGITFSFVWPVLKTLKDPRWELVVAAEVDDAVAWLQSAMIRSLGTGADFTLTVENQEPKDSLEIKWKTSGKSETWSSKRITFRSLNYESKNSTYTSGFQKLSPALTIQVHYGDDEKDRTDWRISISVYGYIRAFRQS